MICPMDKMKLAAITVFAMAASLANAQEVPQQISCHTTPIFPADQRNVVLSAKRTDDGVLIPVRVNDSATTLWFIFDTGAGRTIIDRAVVGSLGLKATSRGTITGVGSGSVAVDIIEGVSLSLGSLRLNRIDLRVAKVAGDVSPAEQSADGIIGFDLLCASVVTLDVQTPQLVVTLPVPPSTPTDAEVLPLKIRDGWIFVRGTIKVPGNPPVTDDFLVDSGSLDAVNHPIIRKSTGPLRRTRTGAGGFGESQAGVIGKNEWFQIGRTRIPNTVSACCAASEEVSRQIGLGILSHFRITFDYPTSRMILEELKH